MAAEGVCGLRSQQFEKDEMVMISLSPGRTAFLTLACTAFLSVMSAEPATAQEKNVAIQVRGSSPAKTTELAEGVAKAVKEVSPRVAAPVINWISPDSPDAGASLTI